MSNAIDLEVMPVELAQAVKDQGISPATASAIAPSFAPLFQRANEILASSKSVCVTDVSQKEEMKKAREYRLGLKTVRVEAEKKKKELKEESLRTGRAIDGFYNILECLTKSEEKRLQDAEDFAERIEAARKAELKAERSRLLEACDVNPLFYALDMMPEDAFAQLLSSSRAAQDAKVAAEKKAEEERIARAKAEAEERERIRLENERLKREAAKREAEIKAEREAAAAAAKVEAERLAKLKAEADEALRKERQAAELRMNAERVEAERIRKEREAEEKLQRDLLEAKAREERQAREKIEAKLRAKQEAERKKAEAEAKAAKRAQLAPDSQKIRAFAGQIRSLPAPAVTSSEAASIVAQIKDQSEKFALWLEKKASELEEVK